MTMGNRLLQLMSACMLMITVLKRYCTLCPETGETRLYTSTRDVSNFVTSSFQRVKTHWSQCLIQSELR